MLAAALLACGWMASAPTGSPTPFPRSEVFRPAEGASPAVVVVLHGSEGGGAPYTAFLAKSLADRGLTAATFCWFDCGAEGVPERIERVELERTLAFVRWVAEQEGRPVVLFGWSRGAEQALLLGSLLASDADVKGIAAHAGSDTVVAAFDPKTQWTIDGEGGWDAAWTWQGEPLYGERGMPFGGGPPIALERYPGPVYLSHGGADPLWPASRSEALSQRRTVAGRDTRLHVWPGEGHVLSMEAGKGLADELAAFAKGVAGG